MQLDSLLTSFILFFLLPLWLLAGFGDWLCHRRTDISKTSGAKESLLHLLMLAEIGIPILAGLLLEINALVLGVMLVGLLTHEATALWDTSYAATRRVITPIEQHIHSFQEVIPLMAFSLVALLHWEQFQALLGMNGQGRYVLELKRHPLPPGYVSIFLGAAVLFEVLPFVEEFWRGLWRNNGLLVPPRGKKPG